MSSKVLAMKPEGESLKTGLDAKVRKKIAGKLSTVLADTILLQIKTQVYHWNVVGPLFKPLHELTEEHYNNLFAAADEIAERIRMLGHPAPQSFSDLMPRAEIDEESHRRSALEMVEQLVADHEKIVQNMRDTARQAEEAGDFATHDLLTGRLAFHEKAIWMLRSIAAG